jgi:hypothetical protein
MQLANLDIDVLRTLAVAMDLGGFGKAACMSSEHSGRLAWQFKRVSGSSGLKVQAAIAC